MSKATRNCRPPGGCTAPNSWNCAAGRGVAENSGACGTKTPALEEAKAPRNTSPAPSRQTQYVKPKSVEPHFWEASTCRELLPASACSDRKRQHFAARAQRIRGLPRKARDFQRQCRHGRWGRRWVPEDFHPNFAFSIVAEPTAFQPNPMKRRLK